MRSAITVLLLILATQPLAAQEYDLEIITPHNENIQAEFERAFSAHVGRPLKIRWIKKGTGDILKQLEAQQKASPGRSFGLDVFFGGGVPDHDEAAQQGYLERANVAPEILAGIPREIAGVANFGTDNLWIGSALSAFGILQNRRGLQNQNLPPVATWEDLAQPALFSWVVIADPRKSSSVRVSYELVLQHYGWERGWPLLMQMAANSRTIADTSSSIPNEVATGNVLAGPCIDFYAYGRVAQAGPEVLNFVIPAGASAITPDPIAMLRQPPHRALAEQFIAFVLSPEGQRLWILPVGAAGGPAQHALNRMPVRPDVCRENAAGQLITDPYREAEAGKFFKVDDALQRARNTLLSELMGAALVDLHADLRETWKALIDGGMKPAALAEWRRVPFTEAEALEISKKLQSGDREARRITREWTNQFRDKYKRVKELSK
jgi:ABC-type Fe3+ transport system substrate-binding protein